MTRSVSTFAFALLIAAQMQAGPLDANTDSVNEVDSNPGVGVVTMNPDSAGAIEHAATTGNTILSNSTSLISGGVLCAGGPSPGSGNGECIGWDSTASCFYFDDDNNGVRSTIPGAEACFSRANAEICADAGGLGNPVATDDAAIPGLPFAIEVKRLRCFTEGTSTPTISLSLDECDSAGANCVPGGISATCDEDGAEDVSFTDARFDADDAWLLDFGTPSGTVEKVTWRVCYVRVD